MTFSGALVSLLFSPFLTSDLRHELILLAQTLTDLNDYITPSQACIKPVVQSNAIPKARGPGDAAVRVLMLFSIPMILSEGQICVTDTMQTEIQIDANGAYYEVDRGTVSSGGSGSGSSPQKLQTAEISLNDCLACRCDVSRRSPLLFSPPLNHLQRLHHLRRVRPHHPPITHGGPFRPRREP
jgi:hypothetical protein